MSQSDRLPDLPEATRREFVRVLAAFIAAPIGCVSADDDDGYDSGYAASPLEINALDPAEAACSAVPALEYLTESTSDYVDPLARALFLSDEVLPSLGLIGDANRSMSGFGALDAFASSDAPTSVDKSYYSTESALMVLATGKDTIVDFVPSEEGMWAGLTGAAVLGGLGFGLGGPVAAESIGEVGFELGTGLYETYEDLTNRGAAVESLLYNFDSAEQSNMQQGGWPTPMPGPTPAPEANPSPLYSATFTPDMIYPQFGVLK
jgi:hypothetical protein